MSLVDNVADHLAATTIAPLAPEGANNVSGGAPINAAQNEAVIAAAVEGRRLYIGNLAYATTEADLKNFFTGYAVESTSIPTNPRTTRPVGYAFVDVVTADEAQRAMTELSGQTILDRKVSVQQARKPETAAEKAASNENAEGGRRVRNGRGRNGRSNAGRRRNEADDSETPAESATAAAEDASPNTEKSQPKPNGTARQPRRRGPPEDGVPSKNKIMVANLPYDFNEEKLKELFEPYQPTAAKIALRPIARYMVAKLKARGEARKGRGFGFISVASEDMQQRAVSEMNGKEVNGREIAVKVAIDSPGKEEVDPEAAGTAPLTANGVLQANDPPAA